jgi:hypothetical protein
MPSHVDIQIQKQQLKRGLAYASTLLNTKTHTKRSIVDRDNKPKSGNILVRAKRC